MDVHKNARSLPASRALLVDRVERQGWALSAAAEAAGLSVRRSREWRRRAKAGEPLEDRSSRPKRQPTRIAEQEQGAIIELRKRRMTVRQIAKLVGRSAATVARVCGAAGMGRLQMLDAAAVPIQRYEHAARAVADTQVSRPVAHLASQANRDLRPRKIAARLAVSS
jgi:transposase